MQLIRRFRLFRNEDPTGISGTGYIAEGCIFSNGVVVLNWLGVDPSVVVRYPSTMISGATPPAQLHERDKALLDRAIDSLYKIHGHKGKTEIHWLDQ